MADEEPSTSTQNRDIVTRYRTRQRTSRQAAGATLATLTSPSSKLDEYFDYCPPRKSQRLAAKNAKDVFKQVRQRGGSAVVPPLTGYLGSIPQEVRNSLVFNSACLRCLQRPIIAHYISYPIYDCPVKTANIAVAQSRQLQLHATVCNIGVFASFSVEPAY